MRSVEWEGVLKHMDSFLACLDKSSCDLIDKVNLLDKHFSDRMPNDGSIFEFEVEFHGFHGEVST